MTRIKIEDLPKNMKISAEQLPRVRGGDLVLDYKPPILGGVLVGLGYGGQSPLVRVSRNTMVGSWSAGRILR